MVRCAVAATCWVGFTGHALAHPESGPGGERAGTEESLQNGGTERPWAKGVAELEQRAALTAFRTGNVQLNDGLFAKAADRYREALQHWDHPAIHYNLALALMNLDQPIEAYQHLQAAVKYGDAPLQSKDKYDHAKDYMLVLDKALADVEVSCDKPGAKVSVDGREVFVAPGRYGERVKVGKHTFVAEKQGYTTRINAPYIGSGEHFRIELKLYTAEELTRYRRRWHATWLPYAAIGGAVAFGVAGGALELSARSSFHDYDANVASCSEMNSGCPQSPALRDLRTTGETRRTLGEVGYTLAGAALVSAGVLWFLNRSEAYQIRAEDLATEPVSVAPLVSPGLTGAAVQGRF
jgi:hypothetical protein